MDTILVQTDDGKRIDPNSLEQTLSYNVDGTLKYISVVSTDGVYKQSFTYTGGKVTGISKWVKQ